MLGAAEYMLVLQVVLVYGLIAFLLYMIFRAVKAFEKIASTYEKKNSQVS